MYHAPAVNYPTGRATGLAVMLGSILLLAAMTALVYSYGTYGKSQPWQMAVIFASWVFAAACAWQFIDQLKRGLLHFDGAAWFWAGQEGVISVHFDAQRGLLLRFDALAGQTRWLWLARDVAPTHWHALRCAVYSRA